MHEQIKFKFNEAQQKFKKYERYKTLREYDATR